MYESDSCKSACVCVYVIYYKFFFFRLLFADLIRYKSIWHIFFQLLDTLPVCQDFNRQVCNRPACKFIHLSDGELFVRYWKIQVDYAHLNGKQVIISLRQEVMETIIRRKCSMFGS